MIGTMVATYEHVRNGIQHVFIALLPWMVIQGQEQFLISIAKTKNTLRACGPNLDHCPWTMTYNHIP